MSTTAAPTIATASVPDDMGKEVPLGNVSRELHGLFASEKAVTRASLMNFAIYSESDGALAANTELIREITREHACRALLLQLEPVGQPPAIRTWITAHCNLGPSGGKRVCSEQVSFLMQGGSPGLLSNTLFAHLDSDLPLVFWWQGAFTDRWEPTLYSRIDRLLLDSGSWSEPLREFKLLEEAYLAPGSRFTVLDLTWTRILQLRLALAGLFDEPHSIAALPQLNSVVIRHQKEHALSAKMMVAWMARRVGWTLVSVGEDKTACSYESREGVVISVRFQAAASGAAIQELHMASPEANWKVCYCEASGFWRASSQMGGHTQEQMAPASLQSPANLAVERLRRGCNNKLYFSILADVRQLL